MSTPGKRIGYVDLNLENFHANVYLKILRDDLRDRGFTVAGCWGKLTAEGQAWATKNQVPWCDSVAALAAQVDYLAVLAPSNPEVHLELCELALPCGKPTYVDKTFAPDLATAEKIFALADQHGVVMQTSSALRYTEAQEYVKSVGGPAQVQHMVTWGGGRSFGEYAIHPVELCISCMGPDVRSLLRRGDRDEGASQLLLNFAGGRTAVVNVYTQANTPFMATVTTEKVTKHIPVDTGKIFVNMAKAMLDLFEQRKANIDRQESLAIRRVLDAAMRPQALHGFVAV